MAFTVDDYDDDAFWGDATTFGCVHTRVPPFFSRYFFLLFCPSRVPSLPPVLIVFLGERVASSLANLTGGHARGSRRREWSRATHSARVAPYSCVLVSRDTDEISPPRKNDF